MKTIVIEGALVLLSDRLAQVSVRIEAGRITGLDLGALGLTGAKRRFPWQLSGGMAQRLAFAASRAGGAAITLADEPTKGLDADKRDDVLALLRHPSRDHRPDDPPCSGAADGDPSGQP